MKVPHPGWPGSVRLAPTWHHVKEADGHNILFIAATSVTLPRPTSRPIPFELYLMLIVIHIRAVRVEIETDIIGSIDGYR